ncbi:MAG: hydrogenase maturation protein [Rubrivivax sp.]|nr:hydrogenase maturation protein [Rubrivivax sp.]
MRVLLLAHAFNGLAQRLFVALREAGHAVSVELDIADAVTEEAVALWNPDVVIAPFLKRRIPESVWSRRLCLVVHPGPPGDRGPSALDWAILQGRRVWGVTVLQAVQDLDAGPVWAWQAFAVPAGLSKASLYRRAVCEAAVPAVMAALARVVPGSPKPAPPELAADAPQSPGAAASAAVPVAESAEAGGWQPLVTREQRAIDWVRHDSAEVLRRIRSADSHPGALGELFGEVCRLYDAHDSTAATRERVPTFAWAAPGTVLAHRGPGLLVRTRDGAVWVGHVRREGWRCLEEVGAREPAPSVKLPAAQAFSLQAAGLPELGVPLHREDGGAHEIQEWDELRYVERAPAEVPGARVGWLEFAFHNGALSERQAARLIDALRFARQRDTRVLVLAGGPDFFCNGIHLHEIEAASQRAGDGAADASMRHIEAIDDVCLAILQMTDRLTVSALRGNAGAGGCFLALAADHVWLREGLVLNPHYRNMGNLHGSEYWTYLLPRRAGRERADAVMRERLPMGARAAVALGLADEVLVPGEASDPQAGSAAALSPLEAFERLAWRRALDLASAPDIAGRIAAKAARRAVDEAAKPLAAYRAEELAQMRRNFYGFDPSYHVARHYFVHRKPHARTPRQIALHR